MKCRTKNCGTVICKITNPDSKYCLVCFKKRLLKKDAKEQAEEEIRRYKKGVQVTEFIPIENNFDSFIEDLKGIRMKIKKKTTDRGKVHALFRYS